MVALRDGEQLAYQVSVRSSQDEADGMGVYAEQAAGNPETQLEQGSSSSNVMGSADGPVDSRGMLPVTGEEGPSVWNSQQNESQQGKDHIDAAEFVQKQVGKKFYTEWKEGRVGPQVIGQRFGYYILGTFASMWENEKRSHGARSAGKSQCGSGGCQPNGGYAVGK